MVLLDLLDLIITRSEREKKFGYERRYVSVIASTWECVRHALTTRFSMCFVVRHMVVMMCHVGWST
jgi:hypothetical protein